MFWLMGGIVVRDRGVLPPMGGVGSVPMKARYASPVDWWALDGMERAEMLGVLAVWVPKLVRWFGLRDDTVPPCWFRHDALVQELLALYQYREQQQVLPAAPPSAMLDFQVQLQLALARLRGWVGVTGCNAREHTDTPVPVWVGDVVVHSRWRVEVDEVIDVLVREPVEKEESEAW